MAIGDVVSLIENVATTAYCDILPSSTAEWVIHNIYHEDDVQLEFYDGSLAVVVDTVAGAGVYAKHSFHCTAVRRIRVKNTAGTSKSIGYDGIVTHL